MTSVTRFRSPAPVTRAHGPQPAPRGVPCTDDVRVLTDRVSGEATHDDRWRSTAALRLAAVIIDRPELLSPPELRRLDAALPRLLRAAGPADAGALVALCAALGDRLSP